jgi:hypothetical protein
VSLVSRGLTEPALKQIFGAEAEQQISFAKPCQPTEGGVELETLAAFQSPLFRQACPPAATLASRLPRHHVVPLDPGAAPHQRHFRLGVGRVELASALSADRVGT